MNNYNYHTPVLLDQIISSLNIKLNQKYIDCTLGGGGHTREILKKGGCVLAIDCDIDAIEYAKERLSPFLDAACPEGRLKSSLSSQKTGALSSNPTPQLIIQKGNFADLKQIALKHNFYPVDGILFDLGVSSHQLETPERGFSFNKKTILDMRMDQDLSVKAVDLINGLTEKELYEIFKKFGEEYHSRAIARAIVRARQIKPIQSCDELAFLCSKVLLKKGVKFGRIHPATRIFQALRIVINDELNNLRKALPQAIEILKKEGRIAVISFHSLEDRIVKNFFLEKQKEKIIEIFTKHPIQAEKEEIMSNPRARSAKLRIAIKL